MSLRLLAMSTLVLLVGGALAQDDAAKKELAKLQGPWRVVSAEENKEAVPNEIVENLKFVIKGDELTLAGVENIVKKVAKVKLVVDPSTTPKTIDFKIEAGSEKGTTVEGIYELKDDELRFCACTVGGNRPQEFATKPGSNLILFVLKREKP